MWSVIPSSHSLWTHFIQISMSTLPLKQVRPISPITAKLIDSEISLWSLPYLFCQQHLTQVIILCSLEHLLHLSCQDTNLSSPLHSLSFLLAHHHPLDPQKLEDFIYFPFHLLSIHGSLADVIQLCSFKYYLQHSVIFIFPGQVCPQNFRRLCASSCLSDLTTQLSDRDPTLNILFPPFHNLTLSTIYPLLENFKSVIPAAQAKSLKSSLILLLFLTHSASNPSVIIVFPSTKQIHSSPDLSLPLWTKPLSPLTLINVKVS